MSDFTDEDVQRGADALALAERNGLIQNDSRARAVLAAALPAYRARVRAEALREAAAIVYEQSIEGVTGNGYVVDWLRARADQEGSGHA